MNISFSEIIEKTFDNFKRCTPALLAVTILTGLILFLPQKILQIMALDNMPAIWRRLASICLLFCLAILFAIYFLLLLDYVKRKWVRMRIIKRQKEALKNLCDSQKKIIRDLMKSKTKAIELNPNSGDVIYLSEHLFIHRPQQVVSIDYDNQFKITYVPQLWLIDLYNQKPELFK